MIRYNDKEIAKFVPNANGGWPLDRFMVQADNY